MNTIDTYLENGHYFSKENHLEKFQFTLLNLLTHTIVFFTSLYYLVTLFDILAIVPLFQQFLLAHILITSFSIWLLRKDKKYYMLVSNITIISSTILFYIAFIIMVDDEFRMVWFLLDIFVAFMLMGRKYGITLVIVILLSIIFSFFFFNVTFSQLAIYHFFNSVIVFTIFSFFFFKKIEKDSHEFNRLYKKLSNKISQEVQEKEAQKKMLLQQYRLANMGEMIDSIAHQWRQPLMNINAILMTMERGLETKKEPKVYLEQKMNEVITLTTHMSQTIEDFRALLRSDKERTYFDIGKAINQALELFEESLREIKVNVTKSDDLKFYGYHHEFIQVIIILLHNAMDIFNNRKIKTKCIDIEVRLDKEELYLSIKDNAGGIEESHMPNIFDPYFTTKKSTGGTGLGLYIAKIIIEQNMQGTLSAKNTKTGASFDIVLPSI